MKLRKRKRETPTLLHLPKTSGLFNAVPLIIDFVALYFDTKVSGSEVVGAVLAVTPLLISAARRYADILRTFFKSEARFRDLDIQVARLTVVLKQGQWLGGILQSDT